MRKKTTDQEWMQRGTTANSVLGGSQPEQTFSKRKHPQPIISQNLKARLVFPIYLELSSVLIKAAAALRVPPHFTLPVTSRFQWGFFRQCKLHKLLKHYFISPAPCDRNRFCESRSFPNQFCCVFFFFLISSPNSSMNVGLTDVQHWFAPLV